MAEQEKVKILAAARFKYRSDTLENWQKENPVLLSGEAGVVTDGTETEKIKFGDGVTAWKNLGWWKGPKGEKGNKGEKGEQGYSGVYVGSGEMPDGYNVQIDPNATKSTEEEISSLKILAENTLEIADSAAVSAQKTIEEASNAAMAANFAADLANSSAILKGEAEGQQSVTVEDVSPAEHLVTVTLQPEVQEFENPKLAVWGDSENDRYAEYSIKPNGAVSAPFTILFAAVTGLGDWHKQYTSRHYQIFASKEKENLFDNPDWTYEYKYEATDTNFAGNGYGHIHTVTDENVKDINYIAVRFYHRPYNGLNVHCAEMAVYNGKFFESGSTPYILQAYPENLAITYGENILSNASASAYAHWDEYGVDISNPETYPTVHLQSEFWNNEVDDNWFADTNKILTGAPNDLEQKEAYIEVNFSLVDTIKDVKSIAPVMHMQLLDCSGGSSDSQNIKIVYNRDINKAFEELKNAIISLGGNV